MSCNDGMAFLSNYLREILYILDISVAHLHKNRMNVIVINEFHLFLFERIITSRISNNIFLLLFIFQ
jgi:hypothetical protein